VSKNKKIHQRTNIKDDCSSKNSVAYIIEKINTNLIGEIKGFVVSSKIKHTFLS
jgi:hypothetical protein